MVRDTSGNIVRLLEDPLKFKSNAISCSFDNLYLNNSVKNLTGDFVKNKNSLFTTLSENCRKNCTKSNTICPNYCYCRWFNMDRVFGKASMPTFSNNCNSLFHKNSFNLFINLFFIFILKYYFF